MAMQTSEAKKGTFRVFLFDWMTTLGQPGLGAITVACYCSGFRVSWAGWEHL
jgi:hypothetical protein